MTEHSIGREPAYISEPTQPSLAAFEDALSKVDEPMIEAKMQELNQYLLWESARTVPAPEAAVNEPQDFRRFLDYPNQDGGFVVYLGGGMSRFKVYREQGQIATEISRNSSPRVRERWEQLTTATENNQ